MENEKFNGEAAGSAEADILEEQLVIKMVKREVLKTYFDGCTPQKPAHGLVSPFPVIYKELKSTQQIIRDVAEMVVLTADEVNSFMISSGFCMEKDADGIPAWAMWKKEYTE